MGLFSRRSGVGISTNNGLETDGDLLTREQTEVQEPGDHERFSHYVKKEKIVESAVTGTPVTALCGKKWIPTRDPERFPICPTCKELYASLPGGKDINSDSNNQ